MVVSQEKIQTLNRQVADLTQKNREQSDQIDDLTRQWREDRQKLDEREQQLRRREQEEQNEKQHLKELMSPIFREGGDIQLLCEETFTIKTMEQTLQCPSLADEFRQLLQQGDHALDPRSQTALAFSYASQYLEFTKVPDRTFNFIQAARAMHEVKQKKATILRSPDDVLFCRSGVNEQIKKIEAGTMQPQKTWEGGEKASMQSEIESILATANLQKDGLTKWEERKQYPHRREFVDLSSLSLSYQGQHLRSVETIALYKVEGILFPQSETMNMKLTTMDNQNYFSFSNDSSKNSDL